MNAYTAHLKPGREPILVKDAFSWGALFFGPLWFAAHRAWIPAVLHLALLVILAALLPPRAAPVILTSLSVLAGLLGRDILCWALERRGYTLSHVLAARDEEGAMARLLTYRPDIASSVMATLQ